jgi:hypothetical protein
VNADVVSNEIPSAFVQLIIDCWATDAAARPLMVIVVERLTSQSPSAANDCINLNATYDELQYFSRAFFVVFVQSVALIAVVALFLHFTVDF